MAEFITKIRTSSGDKQIDYNALANKPKIPTKTSELTNDSGFKTTDNNTTYTLSKSGSTITLTGSDGKTTSVTDADTNTTYGAATSSALGLVKVGYTESGKNYPVELNSSNQMYVNVPWTDTNTDTNTTYSLSKSGSTITLTGSDGSETSVTDSNTTYSAATTSAAGLMSASDKSKLDGITAGANKYTLPVATSSALGGVKSGTDITVDSSGNVSVNDDSHNHIISNVDGLQDALDGKSDTGHTHNYAGSSSAGGAATSANKLNTNAGSATNPVYFENGIPVKTTYTLEKSVPSNAVFTDTTYSAATTSTAGLMSASDKSKLNGIATGAEVNQNAFSNVVIGETTISADNKTDTLTLVAGSNITLTPDATNDKVTIAATNTTYSAAGSALGLVKSGGDVTISSGVITVNDDSHNHVISNVDGLQAALDGKETSGAASSALTEAKSYTDTKISDLINSAPTTLDTLGEIAAAMEENADVVEALESAIGTKADSNHTHNYAGSSSAGGAATSANKLNTDAGSATNPVYFVNGVPVKTTYTLSKSVPSNAVFTDTTYSAATTTAAGLMSASDKTKLNGVATGAEVNQNAFSNFVVGSTTIAADSKTDTLTLVAGENITLTPDATSDKITISAAAATEYSAAGSSLGLVKSGGDVTISSGVITVNDDSHNHTVANIDGLQTVLDNLQAEINALKATIAALNLGFSVDETDMKT